jgi:zinc/manganese transport system permease protein
MVTFVFSFNLVADLEQMWHYSFMRNAFEAGTLTAIFAGVTGYFVVLRRSAFVAHAFSDMGFAGAEGVVLLNIAPIFGLLAASILGALGIAALGRRSFNRATTIGIVLAFVLGLGLAFNSLFSQYEGGGKNISQAYSILFGNIYGISTFDVFLTLYAFIGILAFMAFLYRPLLFASLDEDVAEAKGLPMLWIGISFMLLIAVAVSFAVLVTGTLLIFSLMVTPGATAQYLARRPRWAIIISVAIALAAMWSGVFISFYTSYPVSFYITAEVFTLYIIVRILRWALKRRVRPEELSVAPVVTAAVPEVPPKA